MTFEQKYVLIHEVMRRHLPVEHNNIRYDRILEWVSWYTNEGEHQISVVLQEKRNCVRVPVDEITILEK